MDVYRPAANKYKRPTVIAVIITGLVATLFLNKWDSTPIIDASFLRIGAVAKETFEIEVSASGHIRSKSSGSIASRDGGFVVRRYVSNGDTVKQGDILFELDNPILVAEYLDAQDRTFAQQSKAELDRLEMLTALERGRTSLVRARLELKNKELEKNAKEALFKQGNSTISLMDFQRVSMEHLLAISTYESETAIFEALENSREAKLLELESSEKIQKDKLSRLKASVEALSVRATHGGVIQDISVEEGDRVEALTLLCRIPNNQELYVSAKIPAYEIGKVEVGQKAKVSINQETFRGKVSRIDPLVVDSLVNVDLSIKQISDSYRVNTPVRVVISGNVKPAAMTVTRPVNVRENTESYVYVIENEIAKRRPVSFGAGSIAKIEVLSGLDVGEKIIISEISNSAKDASTIRIQQ